MARAVESERATRAATRGPVRTCVGCRRRGPRSELLRFVVDDRGHLRIDPDLRAPGRGAHACASPGCVARGLQQGFARSLRRRIAAVEPARFVAETRSALEAAAAVLEARAWRDGRLRDGGLEPRVRRSLERLREQARALAVDEAGGAKVV